MKGAEDNGKGRENERRQIDGVVWWRQHEEGCLRERREEDGAQMVEEELRRLLESKRERDRMRKGGKIAGNTNS